MEVLELVLLLLVATLLSSVLDEILPHVSLPLVQIGLGVVIALISPKLAGVSIDPELFLVLFIGPLLFDETRHVDKLAIWRNKWSIVSLAVGLVIVCALAVGYVTHLFAPSIALASAFALGAALGPTDAAAVAAMGKDVKLTSRQKALLSGEALINDASGVVSFQFAIAAAVTGAFSLLDASTSFLFSFFGGVAIGLVLGGVLRTLKRVLRSFGLENATVSTVLEVLAPFIFFLGAEHFGGSGILAVVAGGLVMNVAAPKSNPYAAKANIVSNSVWEILIFVINGVVFVTLGMQIPNGISPTWEDVRFSTAFLLGLVLLITFVITFVRFLWLLVLEILAKPENELAAPQTGTIVLTQKQAEAAKAIDPFADPLERKRIESGEEDALMIGNRKRSLKELCHSALITTLAGPKGAVTMSVIMTIPFHTESGAGFPFRDMLIFLASGVIVCTLLLANFLLPILAKGESQTEEPDNIKHVQIRILRQVIAELSDNMNPSNEKATRYVFRRYRERIRVLRASTVDAEAVKRLRLVVLEEQQEAVHQEILEGEVSKEIGQRFADKLKRMHRSVSRGSYSLGPLRSLLSKPRRAHIKPSLSGQIVDNWDGTNETELKREEIYRLVLETETRAITALEPYLKSDDANLANAAAYLIAEHQNILTNSKTEHDGDASETLKMQTAPMDLRHAMHAERNAENLRVKEVLAEGYRMELEKIQEYYAAGKISRKTARELREEVYLLQMDASDALE